MFDNFDRSVRHRLVVKHRLLMKHTLFTVLLACAFGSGVSAQEQEPPHRGPHLLGGLAADFDADQDGVVSREEFAQGAEAMFEELDRNADGSLAADELPRFRGPRHGRGGPGKGRGPMAGMILARGADSDADGAVASQEWQAFLDSLEIGADGAITEDSLRAALPRRGPPRREPSGDSADGGDQPRSSHLSRIFDRDGDAVLTIDDLNAAFAELDGDGNGELQAEELPRFRGHRGPPTR